MSKLPYFPLDARDYLLDDKLPSLSYEERGLLMDLWCHMWINKVKRGHLLNRENGSITGFSDQQIANILRIKVDAVAPLKQKLSKEVPILVIGKYGELYSERLSKYKTQYELYEKPSGKNRKSSGNHRNLSEQNIIRKELEYNKNNKEREGNGKKDCPHCGQKDMVIQKKDQTTFLPHECKK